MIITKELVQNALDAVRESDDKNVTVHFDKGQYNETTGEYELALRVIDTGKGMTKNELETVFTDLGSSGKRDMAEASGGFGLAKAAPLMMSKRINVATVMKEGDAYDRHSFTATPEDLLGEGVDVKTEKLETAYPPTTGTTVTTYLPDNTSIYGALSHLSMSKRSLRLPGNIRYFESGTRARGQCAKGFSERRERVHNDSRGGSRSLRHARKIGTACVQVRRAYRRSQ